MTEVLATLGPCCGILRRGMKEPNVMHNNACRQKHDGCLGPTIYLVDSAELERLRAELSAKNESIEKERERCAEICKEVMRYHARKAESIDDEIDKAFREGESCGAEDCAEAIKYGIAEWIGGR